MQSEKMNISVQDAIFVAIGGGHASGKQSGAEMLKEQLSKRFQGLTPNILLLDMKQYFIPNTTKPGARTPLQYNFGQLREDLKEFLHSENDVIILYGLYALYDSDIVDMATVRVYIDCDADVRLGRWIKRDVLCHDLTVRNESAENKEQREAIEKAKLEKLLNSYLNYSRYEMKMYIQDTKENADVILPKGADISGFTLIVDGLQSLLLQRLETNSHKHSTSNSNLSNLNILSRSQSSNSFNRESVLHSIKMLSQEPSVRSLTNDNFSTKNKIFYDVN